MLLWQGLLPSVFRGNVQFPVFRPWPRGEARSRP